MLPTEYQQFIHLSRYARWDYDKGRRETWNETIERYFDFFTRHLEKNHKFKLDNGERVGLEKAVKELQAHSHDSNDSGDVASEIAELKKKIDSVID